MFRQLGRCARRLRLRPPLNKWRHSTVVGIALLRKTWPLGLYSNTVPVSLRRAFATQIKLQKGTSASGIPYTDDSVYLHNAIESRTEMRILELNPPDPQDQSKLCGQLVVAKIEDSPDYEVWTSINSCFFQTRPLQYQFLGLSQILEKSIQY